MWINTRYSVDNLFTTQDVAFYGKMSATIFTPYTFYNLCDKLGPTSMNVVIIGAGRIGQAFNYLCGQRANSIAMFDADPTKIPDQRPLPETIPRADVIFLCIQSFAIRDVLAEIGPLLKPTALVVSLAKGIERGSLKTLDLVIPECLPVAQPWGIIIGPMLSEEILQGQGSAGVFVGPGACSVLSSLIDPNDLSLECSNDTHGVALAGVLKNIYALALGIGDGIGWGANRKGWLITRAIREMREILSELGGDPNTADGPAGLGDLIATGSSPHSRNRGTGEQIVKTGEMNPLSEGYISLTSLMSLLGPRAADFEILSALVEIIGEKKDAATVYKRLI